MPTIIDKTAKVYKRWNNYIWKAALTKAECHMKSEIKRDSTVDQILLLA